MQRLGDTELARTLVRSVQHVARRVRSPENPHIHKFLEAVTVIRQNPLDAESGYLARPLVQCTLPHRNPGNVPFFARRNGTLELTVSAGRAGFPYGTTPRLLLCFLNTEVVRTRSRRIELGDCLSTFCRAVGLNPNGGDARRLRDQMNRLFGSTISFQVRAAVDGYQVDRTLNMQVAAASELWWNPKTPDQRAFFSSWVELGEKFVEAILAAPVPLDLRALRALKRSPLALDVYLWLNYRTFTVRKPTFVTWEQLKQQFGAEFGNVKDFKKKTLRALRKVLAVQPQLNVRAISGGLRLSPSRPTIAPRVLELPTSKSNN